MLALVGEKYPVEGTLTGQFHGRGRRQEPAITGLFDLADGKVYGFEFNRLRGQVNVQPDEARISNAELRVFAPGKETGGAGIITGSVGYQFSTKNVSAELVGAGLPLRNIETIQSDRLPISGQISFHLKASGPYQAPIGDGSMTAPLIGGLRVEPAPVKRGEVRVAVTLGIVGDWLVLGNLSEGTVLRRQNCTAVQ